MRELRRHQWESPSFSVCLRVGTPLSAPGFSRMIERAAVAADLGLRRIHMLRRLYRTRAVAIVGELVAAGIGASLVIAARDFHPVVEVAALFNGPKGFAIGRIGRPCRKR
jgi:hypothetical protein